jgi:DinB superfamily
MVASMKYADLIDDYATGAELLRQVTKGMTREQALARPVPGKWSTLEVVCHLADFEIVCADRMKRVIAEHEPTMFVGDPDVFASRLAYHSRDLADELRLIESVRVHVARILRTLGDDDFSRIGMHSEAGPLSLASLLQSVTNHVIHHGKFIEEKRAALEI